MPDRSSLLQELGIVGYDEAFVSIVAAFVSELPLLLIGSHGSAKTLLCERLAAALGERFIAYDASKALFEDILGFPDPTSLAEGAVRYVATPISIWDKGFVLIDELSRATPEMQNKWLEVIRSRRLMGEAIPHLRYLFAAMNPSEYLGAHELDPALVGRFAFFVRAPALIDLTVEERLRVIEGEARPPAPARIAEAGRRLRTLIVAARRRLATLPQQLEERLRHYVHELWAELHKGEIALDGRRLALLYQGLRACVAVAAAQGSTWEQAVAEIRNWIAALIPPGEDDDPEQWRTRLLAAHIAARNSDGFSQRPAPGDLLALMEDISAETDDATLRAHYERIRNHLTAPEDERRAEAVVALETLAAHLCQQPALAPDQRFEVLELYRRLIDLEPTREYLSADRHDYLSRCRSFTADDGQIAHAALLAVAADNYAERQGDDLTQSIERRLQERSRRLHQETVSERSSATAPGGPPTRAATLPELLRATRQ